MSETADRSDADEVDRTEIAREAVTMVLYTAVVLLAALVALPAGEGGEGDHGEAVVRGASLLGLIWGTCVGLALAHWFAFRVTARGFGGGHATRQDNLVALAQLGGAVVVAALCSLPLLVLPEDVELGIIAFAPAAVVGLAAYLAARVGGRRRALALLLGGIALLVGVVVAVVKNLLAGH